MGFLSFLKSKPEPEAKPVSAPSAGSASAPPASPAAAVEPEAIVCRAEIVDERYSLSGYRFSAPLPEPAMLAALAGANLAEFAQKRLALVQITPDAVAAGLHAPLVAPQTVFLLDRQGAGLPAEQIASLIATLRATGCKVALRGVTLEAEDAQLPAVCDFLLLGLNDHTLADFQTLSKQLRLRYPELKLIVDGVGSWDEQRMCASWGANYFMGHFLTTTDKVDPEAKIDQSRMTSIELLNLLRTDAELPAMIEVAKRDPGMTYQVLQWANAPGSGQTTKVTSLQQAFLVLGRNQLYRGLTVSMFRLGAGATRERDESLLEVALTRARFLETCSKLPQAKRDELFLVGLLSLFDVLLGVPMAKLVDQMKLSDEIRDVLLGTEGAYGPYLTMVLLLERNKVDRALAIAATLEVDVDSLPQVGQAAFEWAQESLQQTGAE